MSKPEGYIEYLRRTQPAIIKTLEMAAEQGLVVLDEEIDALGATNRLLFTNPIIHEVLNSLISEWADYRADTSGHFSSLLRGNDDDEA